MNGLHGLSGLAIAALLVVPSATAAQKAAANPPAVFNRVVACKAITDAAARLACFDREVAAMDQAQRSGEIVAFDRQQVRSTRRSLFGLALPNLGIFGDSTDEDGASQIETTIKAARQVGGGKWIFDLAEGGRWEQLDTREFIVDPAPGQPIRIRRAAMGSYLANVNKQIAVRVRRVN